MLKIDLGVDFLNINIGPNEAGQRLDKFLRKLLKDVPLSAIFKALRKGDIRVDGKKQKEKLNMARNNNNFENIKCLERDLSFYGSGAILHKLFFENMGPAIPTSPDDSLMEQIIKDFGNYDKFKNQFTEAAKAVEASRLVFTSLCF